VAPFGNGIRVVYVGEVSPTTASSFGIDTTCLLKPVILVGEEQKLSFMPDAKEKARRRELYSGIPACVRQFEPRGARALATSLWIAVALRSDQTSRSEIRIRSGHERLHRVGQHG
jgi:hypothetical protein